MKKAPKDTKNTGPVRLSGGFKDGGGKSKKGGIFGNWTKRRTCKQTKT